VTQGAPQAGAEREFHVSPGLRLRSWGEETDVVYLPATRNTHLVDAATGSVLQGLLEMGGRATVGALWLSIQGGSTAQLAPTDDETQMLVQRLDALCNLGLVA
jgi:hypothetical protein